MTTPRATLDKVLQTAKADWLLHPQRKYDTFPSLFVLGVRGYYRDTMGKPGTNDRGIYDDALFICAPDVFAAFNANTDPSVTRTGVATLLPGIYPYRPGLHGVSGSNPYPAFRPATPGEALPVRRDDDPNVPSLRPGVAINIHKGGYNTTSSLGCQTIIRNQWDAFHSLLSLALRKLNQKTFWYILHDGPIA